MSSITRSRRAIAAAAVAGLAALTAGCGTSGHSTPPTKTVTVTDPSSSASPGQSASASPTPVASSAGLAACATRDLKASLGLGQGAMGSIYQVIDFTNIDTATCTLYGFPGVALMGGSPLAQVGVAADENSGQERQLVTLAPGGAANALLQMEDAPILPARRCHPVHTTYLQIYPPNQTTPIYLAYRTIGCAKPVHLLAISVVKPGSGG